MNTKTTILIILIIMRTACGKQQSSGSAYKIPEDFQSINVEKLIFAWKIKGQEYPVIFAYSNKDDFTSMHVKRGKARIKL